MKKIIAFLTALFISIIPFSGAFAEENNSDYIKAANILNHVGVIEFTDISEIDKDKEVSRAEFATYVSSLLNLKSSQSYARLYFNDVDEGHWAKTSINLLVERGCIAINDERLFKPDNIITYAEACKILLCCAGYEPYANALGDFPRGYLKIAEEAELNSKIADKNALRLSECIELLYNASMIGLYEPEIVVGSASAKYYVNEEKTLLSEGFGIKKTEGTINSIYGAELDERFVVAEENQAYVDAEKYDTSNVNMDEFFASYAEIVYKEDSDENKSILHIEKFEKKNKVIVIEGNKLDSFDKNTYKIFYEKKESERVVSKDILENAVVIFNGKPDTSSLDSLLDDFITGNADGRIILKENDEGDYATVIIESYKTLVVDKNYPEDEIIYGYLKPSDAIVLKDADAVVIKDRNGNKVKQSDVARMTVLSYAVSTDKKYVKIIVNNNGTNPVISVETITAKNLSDDIYIKTVDNEYKVSGDYKDKLLDSLKLGNEYTLYFDYFGRVAYSASLTSEFLVGYLVKCTYDTNEGISTLKLFTQNGDMQRYQLAEKIRVDSITYKGDGAHLRVMDAVPETRGIVDITDANNVFNRPVVTPQIIRYKVNNEGDINEIDTYRVAESEDSKNTLTRHPDSGRILNGVNYGNGNSLRFGPSIIFSVNKTMHFTVPYLDANGYMLKNSNNVQELIRDEKGNPTYPDDGDYSVNKVIPQNNNQLYIEAYSTNQDTFISDIVVSKQTFENSDAYMVGKTKIVLNEDDEVVRVMTLYDGRGNAHKVKLAPSCSVTGINVGDLVVIERSNNGDVAYSLHKKFDCKTRKFTSTNSNLVHGDKYSYSYQDQMSRGYVSKVKDDIITWSYELPLKDEAYDELAHLPMTVCFFDSVEMEAKAGTVSEARDYSNAGSKCSYIVYCTSYDSYRGTFIYK